jgi:predicted XRE-type DNA-binding protein/phage-related protein
LNLVNRRLNEQEPKPVRWVGRSRDDPKSFPRDVQRRVGGALWDAQIGLKAPYAKPLKGFGSAGVLEIVDDFDGDTYRAVYTVRFAHVVYVLHAFSEEIEAGRGDAESRVGPDCAAAKKGERGLRPMAKKREAKIAVTPSSGNVFADLGFPEPAEELAKAKLASRIRLILKDRHLTQVAAAELMGIDQPKVSALLNGRLANFSSERLMRLLTALGQDVDIVIRAKPRSCERGRVRVLGEVNV